MNGQHSLVAYAIHVLSIRPSFFIFCFTDFFLQMVRMNFFFNLINLDAVEKTKRKTYN